MSSITKKIESKINTFEKGKIFFAEDFINYGSNEAIRQSLVRLTKRSQIVRVAQGIYYYPLIDNRLGLGFILPTFEQIAEAIARRTHSRIIPTGEYALNLLGLSTQVPMNYVFLTDGKTRFIKINNDKGIMLKNTAPRNLLFSNKLAMLITSALRSISQKNISEEHVKQIHTLLKKENKDEVINDICLMPVWIRKIVLNAYD